MSRRASREPLAPRPQSSLLSCPIPGSIPPGSCQLSGSRRHGCSDQCPHLPLRIHLGAPVQHRTGTQLPRTQRAAAPAPLAGSPARKRPDRPPDVHPTGSGPRPGTAGWARASPRAQRDNRRARGQAAREPVQPRAGGEAPRGRKAWGPRTAAEAPRGQRAAGGDRADPGPGRRGRPGRSRTFRRRPRSDFQFPAPRNPLGPAGGGDGGGRALALHPGAARPAAPTPLP